MQSNENRQNSKKMMEIRYISIEIKEICEHIRSWAELVATLACGDFRMLKHFYIDRIWVPHEKYIEAVIRKSS